MSSRKTNGKAARRPSVGTIPNGAETLALLSVIYDVTSPLEEWLRGVAERCAAHLDEGTGVEAYFFDLESAELASPLLVGGTEAWQGAWRKNWWDVFMVPLDASTRRALHSMGVCIHSVHLWDAMSSGLPTYRDFLANLARSGYGRTHARYAHPPEAAAGDTLIYPDSFNVLAMNPHGLGCVLAANRASAPTSPPRADVARFWECVAGHAAAAIRLRSKLAAGQLLDGASAVLDAARGAIAHAAPSLAKDDRRLATLRASMVAIDRLHGRDASAEEAVETWRALHEGEYSILDTFDRDGRRYYVAHPNSSRPNASCLAPRERQVMDLLALGHSNKFIAYELGIAPSTVAALLGRVARKLGTKSRIELVRMARKRG
jgi:DNA-binding NarL/FixJ family response regulator